MDMSYRRAWLLVDAMNRCWREPLVATAPGGSARAGARLTDFGRDVLTLYRALQRQADAAGQSADWAVLAQALRAQPSPIETIESASRSTSARS
jgi:molybdate transport system regulatory protein